MNQHYVPQSYLNKFSEPNKKKSIISVYDKIEKRYFKTGSKAICSEINLYTLDEHNKLSKDILGIEKLYANEIEPLYLKSYELLTNPQVFDISDIQRCEIIFFNSTTTPTKSRISKTGNSKLHQRNKR